MNILQKISSFLSIVITFFCALACHANVYAQETTPLVGKTPSSFNVSQGVAIYDIPIVAPQGMNGLQHRPSLQYNSLLENGLLGVGWDIHGLSKIDNSGGYFYMDNQKLIPISGTNGNDGTEYRTEIETFSKIISHGSSGTGPSYFTVKTKAGLTMEYGNTPDSSIKAIAQTSVEKWMLNKASDISGNETTYTYYNDNTSGENYILNIKYAALAVPLNQWMEFVYEPSTESESSHKRLKSIKTYAKNILVKEYHLDYEDSGSPAESLLKSVQEIVSLKFVQEIVSPEPSSPSVSESRDLSRLTDGFFANEGSLWKGPASVSWFDTTSVFTVEYPEAITVNDFTIQVDNNDSYLIEYSTDGTTYITLAEIPSSVGEVTWGLDTITSVEGDVEHVNFPTFRRGIQAKYFRIQATDGDGMYAISEFQVNPDHSAPVSPSVSESRDLSRLTDGFFANEESLWNGPASVSWFDTNSVFTVEYPEAITVNDFTIQVDNNDSYLIEYSTDGTTYTNLAEIPSSVGEATWGLDTITSVDGDVEHVNFPTFRRGIQAKYFRIQATDGDGMYAVSEFQVNPETPYANSKALPAIALTWDTENRLSSINDGMSKIDIAYATKTNQLVVSDVTIENGIHTSYTYNDQAVLNERNGNLVFSRVISTNNMNGVVTQTDYHQSAPYIGKPTNIEVRLPKKTLIKNVTNLYQTATSSYTGVSFPYMVSSVKKNYELDGAYVSNHTIGCTESAPSGDCEIDDYGNVTKTRVSKTGGGKTFVKKTTNVYTNDPTDWVLGRLDSSTVTYEVDNGEGAASTDPIKLNYTFTYDSQTGLLNTKTGPYEYDTALQSIETYTYNPFGNKISETLSLNGKVTTTKKYDSIWGMPTLLEKPGNLTTKWQYNAAQQKNKEIITNGATDSSTDSWFYTWSDETADAVYKITQLPERAPEKTVYYDSMSREIRQRTLGFNGRSTLQDVEYNNLGQKNSWSLPYFQGDTVYRVIAQYDLLGRINNITRPEPNGDSSTNIIAYSGLTITETESPSEAKIRTITMDVLGNVVRVTEHNATGDATADYSYDAMGNPEGLPVYIEKGSLALPKVYDSFGRPKKSEFISNKFISRPDPDGFMLESPDHKLWPLSWDIASENQIKEYDWDSMGRVRDGALAYISELIALSIEYQKKANEYQAKATHYETLVSKDADIATAVTNINNAVGKLEIIRDATGDSSISLTIYNDVSTDVTSALEILRPIKISYVATNDIYAAINVLQLTVAELEARGNECQTLANKYLNYVASISFLWWPDRTE